MYDDYMESLARHSEFLTNRKELHKMHDDPKFFPSTEDYVAYMNGEDTEEGASPMDCEATSANEVDLSILELTQAFEPSAESEHSDP